MKTRIVWDFMFVLLLYAAYAALMVWLYGSERFTGEQVETLPLVMLGISLTCTLLWYVLGEWVIRPSAPAGTWYGVWALLLGVVVAAAAYISFHEGALANQPGHTDAESFPALHFLGGVGCFYLATVLFSPTFSRYRIWPARHVRAKW